MRKLIACDVDGTLISEGEQWISPAVLQEARRLTGEDWLFAFCSGRQLANLEAIAKDLAGRVYYITQNGAAVYASGKQPQLLDKTPLGQENAMKIAHQALETEGYEIEMSGNNISYLCPKTDAFRRYMQGYVNMNITEVPSPEDVPEEIVKISIWCPDAAAAHEQFAARWGSRYRVAIAGDIWLDITLADKGKGIRALCRQLDVALENVVAFGDNYNDVPILDIVGTPYIMACAPEDLQARYPNVCRDVADVLKTL